MSKPKLRQLLDCFEEAPVGLSLQALAQEMGLSLQQVDSMAQYWIRKGRIRIVESQLDCGHCGGKGTCPFPLDLPHCYILVPEGKAE